MLLLLIAPGLSEAKAVLARALEEGGLSASEATQARKYLAASLLADGDLAGARAGICGHRSRHRAG